MTNAAPTPTTTGASSRDVVLVHAPKPRHLTPEHGLASFVNFLPFGLFSIASRLDRAGFRPTIVHLGLERIAGTLEGLPAELRRRGVGLVGISLHWHPSTFDALETARWLKRELPGVTIAFGGITASFFARELFDFDCVDHVVEGDGEQPFTELARAVLGDPGGGPPPAGGAAAVPNVWSRGPDGAPVPPRARHVEDAAALGADDWACLEHVRHRDLLPYMNWALPADAPVLGRAMRAVQRVRPRMRPFTFYPGRGCPISCPICGGNREVMRESFGRRGYTPIPPPALVAMAGKALAGGFSHLVSDTGFGMSDDDLLALLAAFEDARLVPRWTLSTPDLPSPAVVDALVRATGGKAALNLTLESGSARIRRRFRGPAGFDNDALAALLARTERDGIEVQMMLSRNLPLGDEDAREHAAETRRLRTRFARARHAVFANYNLQLDPGSGMYREPERFHCRPLWTSLRDYHDANRRPDAGPGYVTRVHPERTWGPLRTYQLELPEFVVLNNAFRLGTGLERGARRLLGLAPG